MANPLLNWIDFEREIHVLKGRNWRLTLWIVVYCQVGWMVFVEYWGYKNLSRQCKLQCMIFQNRSHHVLSTISLPSRNLLASRNFILDFTKKFHIEYKLNVKDERKYIRHFSLAKQTEVSEWEKE